MTYTVIKRFSDLQDGNHVYEIGDTFPREGVAVSPKRITELAGSENRQRTPLIKAKPEPKKAKAKKKE